MFPKAQGLLFYGMLVLNISKLMVLGTPHVYEHFFTICSLCSIHEPFLTLETPMGHFFHVSQINYNLNRCY